MLFAALLPAVGAYAQDTTPKLNYNSEGFYEIANEEDMIAFITFCRSSKSPTCAGMTFKVTASELNMGDDRFKHITGGFAGTFDGRRVEKMQRGVNIIRANGSVRKVSVK